MQGGFTELMLEQIRNSHEDDQSDSNRQVKQYYKYIEITVHKRGNYSCIGGVNLAQSKCN